MKFHGLAAQRMVNDIIIGHLAIPLIPRRIKARVVLCIIVVAEGSTLAEGSTKTVISNRPRPTIGRAANSSARSHGMRYHCTSIIKCLLTAIIKRIKAAASACIDTHPSPPLLVEVLPELVLGLVFKTNGAC